MYARSLVYATALVGLVSTVASANVLRVDDVLVLEGLELRVEPVGGLNETTSNEAWQEAYISKVDLTRVSAIYQQQLDYDQIFGNETTEVHEESKRDGATCVSHMRSWTHRRRLIRTSSLAS
jgi:hypothetical protein